MVAQAEHIPVHLGAMPESVAAVIAREPRPGDVFVLNDPFAGGSHLPDITIVSPLALEGEIVAYACTRAHHSDVGGIVPGSMPASSTSIWQEGVIVPPVRLDRRGAAPCCSRTCGRRRSAAPTSPLRRRRTGSRRSGSPS